MCFTERSGRRIRRPVIQAGSSPRDCTSKRRQVRVPTTLKEAKPKAGSIAANAIGHACAPQTATRIAHGRHPEANIEIVPGPFAYFSNTYCHANRANPTKTNRVGRRDEKACGFGGSETRSQPWAGMNLRRVEPHERRRANQREGPVVPARPRKSVRVAERRAKKSVGA
jgi:hypothetical protein